MPNRYPKPFKVPELKQKLDLLYRSKLGVEGDDAMGRLFKSEAEPNGITGKAVRYWVYGDGSREPNMVPAQRFDRFVEIFRARLPGNRTTAETRALLTSPSAGELADAFLSGAPPLDWVTLVLGAQPGGVMLLLARRPGVFRVTARRRVLEGIDGQVECPLNQYFQFKLKEIRPGWLTLLQWGQSGWFGLELADEVVSVEHSAHVGLLPVSPPYYIENEPGVRRYLFLTTPTPLPPALLSKIRTSARANVPLDVSVLDRLAHLFGKGHGLIMNALDVRFFNAEKPEVSSHEGRGRERD